MLWWLYKYFPLRKEAITPEQLRLALDVQNKAICDKIEKTDFQARESFNASVGRAQTAFENQIAGVKETIGELKESMVAAHRKAAAAHEEASKARQLAELTKVEMTGLEKLLTEKIDHLTTLVKEKKNG
jgi:hypothetical protein